MGRRVVRTLASHCNVARGSSPGVDVMCGFEFVVGSPLSSERFSSSYFGRKQPKLSF